MHAGHMQTLAAGRLVGPQAAKGKGVGFTASTCSWYLRCSHSPRRGSTIRRWRQERSAKRIKRVSRREGERRDGEGCRRWRHRQQEDGNLGQEGKDAGGGTISGACWMRRWLLGGSGSRHGWESIVSTGAQCPPPRFTRCSKHTWGEGRGTGNLGKRSALPGSAASHKSPPPRAGTGPRQEANPCPAPFSCPPRRGKAELVPAHTHTPRARSFAHRGAPGHAHVCTHTKP